MAHCKAGHHTNAFIVVVFRLEIDKVIDEQRAEDM
jgi:hypothetical protein